jgi:hypothetical protein
MPIRTRRNVGRSPKGYVRRANVRIEVSRRGRAFMACATVPKLKAGASTAMFGSRGYHCAMGRNPRRAVAVALARLGQAIGRRSGAFRGI